ncbi:carbon-nitrogen hydrolase family protein [Sporolactobacillus sp. THM19-2]|uniref:carbon-nitrogen hydrolase family protein n=1 Tax=Sporolactobacillus sp. THM19-2 TaxID=2511171 RepID=UPI00102010D3|nr:carbon-nitrogen hydrolase family protein [Sporolactobacillus sp. THM19-2]RYL88128.1 carbon-nitrogen hydrolase family protein [Sporolactobacillus sp. THM19-2]
MKIALAQLSSTIDKKKNLEKALAFIESAKKQGADFVIFPEIYMALAIPGAQITAIDAAEPLDGPFVSELCKAAKKNGIYVVCGIIETKIDDHERPYNTAIMINREGAIIRTYHKTHLYDVFDYKESDEFVPGEAPSQIVETEFGNIGLMICHELKYPEVPRLLALQRADVVFMLSAWVAGPMKEEQLKTLLSARAIENRMYFCVADQTQNIFIGRSMVVDPLGVVTASAGDEERLVISDIDLDYMKELRTKFPNFSNRRPGLYKGLSEA